jgi:hypothetical protein
MPKKNDLTKSFVPRRFFTYNKSGLPLNFNLRVDNSSELKPFKAILEEAVKDIDEILKGLKN